MGWSVCPWSGRKSPKSCSGKPPCCEGYGEESEALYALLHYFKSRLVENSRAREIFIFLSSDSTMHFQNAQMRQVWLPAIRVHKCYSQNFYSMSPVRNWGSLPISAGINRFFVSELPCSGTKPPSLLLTWPCSTLQFGKDDEILTRSRFMEIAFSFWISKCSESTDSTRSPRPDDRWLWSTSAVVSSSALSSSSELCAPLG